MSRRVISVNYCLLDELNNLKLFNEQHWESGVALELIGSFILSSVNASPVVPPYNEDENGGDDDGGEDEGGGDEGGGDEDDHGNADGDVPPPPVDGGPVEDVEEKEENGEDTEEDQVRAGESVWPMMMMMTDMIFVTSSTSSASVKKNWPGYNCPGVTRKVFFFLPKV